MEYFVVFQVTRLDGVIFHSKELYHKCHGSGRVLYSSCFLFGTAKQLAMKNGEIIKYLNNKNMTFISDIEKTFLF